MRFHEAGSSQCGHTYPSHMYTRYLCKCASGPKTVSAGSEMVTEVAITVAEMTTDNLK